MLYLSLLLQPIVNSLLVAAIEQKLRLRTDSLGGCALISRVLDFLSTHALSYADLPDEIAARLQRMFSTQAVVALPALGSPEFRLLYDSGGIGVTVKTSEVHAAVVGELGADHYYRTIDFRELDELGLYRPYFEIYLKKSQRDQISEALISRLCKDLVLRAVQRERARLRREFIILKSESGDLGSFLHRALYEVFRDGLPCEAGSIFVQDSATEQLRLRRTTGLKNPRPVRDVAFDPSAQSWVVQTLISGRPRFEFSLEKPLMEGRTAEATSKGVYSRLYWPIQIQFKQRIAFQRRPKKQQLGVVRLCNARHGASAGNMIRPFTVLDAFRVEFACEAIFNIIDSFLDKNVEGFERDLAFHSAASVADGCLKNIQMARRLLFSQSSLEEGSPHDAGMPAQFKLTKLDRAEPEDLEQALNNAYSFAQDILAQIERANVTPEENAYPTNASTEKLLSEVIQKAINLIPYMMTSHSVAARREINRVFDQPKPPPVRGGLGGSDQCF